MPAYIDEKIKILKDFGIFLKPDELSHIRGLKTEISVDNYARMFIERKLG
jgi:hypothetical protein